eukprot:scaffold104480_cov26-Tisochrysis_lutea.AAC.1
MVGVLGPEFQLGSQYYAAAKSLITDMGQAWAQSALTCARAQSTKRSGKGSVFSAQAGVLAVDDPPALAALCGAGSSGRGSSGTPGQQTDASTLYGGCGNVETWGEGVGL